VRRPHSPTLDLNRLGKMRCREHGGCIIDVKQPVARTKPLVRLNAALLSGSSAMHPVVLRCAFLSDLLPKKEFLILDLRPILGEPEQEITSISQELAAKASGLSKRDQ
jgi:hypothetical protein